MSRENLENEMDEAIDRLLFDLEIGIKSKFPFLPEYPVTSGVIGDNLMVARNEYKDKLKEAIRKSIWVTEE